MTLWLAGCDGDTSSPTATPQPGPEWAIEDVVVNDATVTLRLRVFAGVDVRATLDSRGPDTSLYLAPTIELVFLNVPEGTHALKVFDVVGHEEKRILQVGVLEAPAGPLDTALATVTIVAFRDGLVTIRVEQIRDYHRFPGATYPPLAPGDTIRVPLVNELRATVMEGQRFLTKLSLCLEGYIGGLSCRSEGWHAAFYAVD